MRSLGIIAFVFSILLAVTATWLNLSWKSIKEFTNEANQSRIDYYMSGFSLIDTDETGSINYKLTGDYLIHKQASGESEIHRPRIKRPNSNGQLLTIVSERAVQTSKDGNITLTGKVQVQQAGSLTTPAYQLLTQSLTYNPVEQKISSQDKSNFISAQGSIIGTGFESKLDDQELRITNAQSEFKAPE